MPQKPQWLLYFGLIALGAFSSLGIYHLVQAIAPSSPPAVSQSPTISPTITLEPESSPSPTSPPPVASPAATPTQNPPPIAEEPNQDSLSMTCSGTIQDSVDFTVYYTREAGFSRIELVPPAGQTLTSTLSYDGKNQDGHGIWRGGVAQMASVVLVHLSTDAAQRGDDVSVGYDGRWGRATCR